MTRYLTTTDVRKILANCSRQHVYALVDRGALRAKRDGTRFLFKPEWVDAYMESSDTVTPMPAPTRKRLADRRVVN